MRETAYIKRFLGHYTDQKLAELLAHCEDGKFAFMSCCCFIGAATADHALQGALPSVRFWDMPWAQVPHYQKAKRLPYADQAETEVRLLGDDETRRKVLIRLVKEEIANRDELRKYTRETKWANAHIRAHAETSV